MEISPEGNEQTLEERLEEREDLRKSYSAAGEHIKESQQRQKKHYDAKHGGNKTVRNPSGTVQSYAKGVKISAFVLTPRLLFFVFAGVL